MKRGLTLTRANAQLCRRGLVWNNSNLKFAIGFQSGRVKFCSDGSRFPFSLGERVLFAGHGERVVLRPNIHA
jgi:hypothetical protein